MVEPLLAATLVIISLLLPLFFCLGKRQHFLIKNSRGHQLNMANSHNLKPQTIESLKVSHREYGHLFEI